VYGLGDGNQHVTVNERELAHILSSDTGANTLITLKVDGSDQLTLARHIQRDPVRSVVVHVDFVRVRADVEIAAEVPVHLVGDAEGVRDGGILEQALFTVSVLAKPGDLPPAIEVEVTALGVGDQIRVEDLTAPAGVTLTQEPDTLVAMVATPAAEEPEVVEGEEELEEGEAPAEGEAEAEPAAGDAESGDAE
jgi:large subunit ribosomal protein L25